MDRIIALGIQSPPILAALFLTIVTITKLAKDRGGALCVLGSVALLVSSVLGPVVYILVMPKLIDELDAESIGNVYNGVNLLMNLAWAGSLTLFALGQLMRRPAEPSPDPYAEP